MLSSLFTRRSPPTSTAHLISNWSLAGKSRSDLRRPPARDVGKLVDLAQADGWEVCVVARPESRTFVDAAALEGKTATPSACNTGNPTPGTSCRSRMIVAPAMCNTIAKWAAGISDTLPLSLIVEAVAKGVPVIAMPSSNHAQHSSGCRRGAGEAGPLGRDGPGRRARLPPGRARHWQRLRPLVPWRLAVDAASA